MKKLNKKLQLNNETIARLTNDQQRSVYGGDLPTNVTLYDCGGGGIPVPTNPTCNGDTCGCQGVLTVFGNCKETDVPMQCTSSLIPGCPPFTVTTPSPITLDLRITCLC